MVGHPGSREAQPAYFDPFSNVGGGRLGDSEVRWEVQIGLSVDAEDSRTSFETPVVVVDSSWRRTRFGTEGTSRT